MNFLIADTFADSLAHLSGDEQKAVKTTAFDLQIDPTAPGLSFRKLDRAKASDLVRARELGYPADRAPHGHQLAALLRQGRRLPPT